MTAVRALTGRRRSIVGAVLAVAVLVGAAGCAKEEGDSEDVRAFIDATAVQAHRFVYTETTPSGIETTVQGIVEDDFRSKAQVAIGGEPVLEQVVSDDLAAVRFLDPDQLGRFIDKEVVSEVDPATDVEGIDVFTALQSKRWVLDPGGAPPTLQSADDQTENGIDPIFDAHQMLVRARALTLFGRGLPQFVKFSEDTISPVYRDDEDPFPQPENGSGLTRYDFPQGAFPKSVDSTELQLPDEAQFRKFSIYVKDGRVVRVSEQIGLSPSVLDNFETFMVQLINQTAPDQVAAGFLANVEKLSGDELGQFLLSSLNTVRDLRGDPPLRFRTATYELLDLGSSALRVEPPNRDVITADLAVLVNLGVKPLRTDDGDDDTESGTGSTTTVAGS